MKKHLLLTLCSVAVVCGVVGCRTNSDPYFDATVKHVDMGGEMFVYKNLSASMRSCENIMAYLEQAAHRPHTKSAVRAFAGTLDLKSIKAVAQSSVQVAPRLHVYKSFVLIEKNSKSILSGKAFRDEPIDEIMKSLPADTRLAIYGNVNSSFLWTRINEEIAASGDKTLIGIMNNVKANFKAKGVDVDALTASLNGPMMLVVAGKSPLDIKFVVIIADKDGLLSNALRKKCPPEAGKSYFPVKDLPLFPKARLVYSEGCVLFVSDPKLLEQPAKMLGETKRFKKFAPQLPKKGCSFTIVDISKNFADTFNFIIPKEYMLLPLKPFSMITVDSASEDGIASVTVSNFSVPAVFPKLMEGAAKGLLAKTGGMTKAIKSKAAPAKKLSAPAKKPAKKSAK